MLKIKQSKISKEKERKEKKIQEINDNTSILKVKYQKVPFVYAY